jgi:hypothetical protein
MRAFGYLLLLVILLYWNVSMAQSRGNRPRQQTNVLSVSSVRVTPVQLKDFPKKVMSIYKNMTFSGAELSLSNSILRDIQWGIAYAQFDKKNNKRYILLNLRYFFDEWQKDSVKTKYQLEGVLAHEWAHHYLGHVFEKGNIIKERDADLVAGRILYELGTSNEIDSIQEKRLTAAFEIIPEKGDPNHLQKEARIFLIFKGFWTGKVIADFLKCGLNEKEISKVDKLLKDLKNEFKTIQKRETLEIQSLVKRNQSAIQKIEQKIEMIEDSLSTLDSLGTLPSDSISFFKAKLNKVKEDLKTGTSKQQTHFKEDSVSIVKKYERVSKDNELQTELIYNLLYLTDPNKIRNESLLNSYWKTDTIDTGIYLYKLKGMCLKFNEKNQKVEFQSATRKVSDIAVKPTPSPFLYEFFVDKSTFYIDQNYNLWTETMAAKPIKNKLFLEKRTIINP